MRDNNNQTLISSNNNFKMSKNKPQGKLLAESTYPHNWAQGCVGLLKSDTPEKAGSIIQYSTT
jgi:hypothetical protein